MQNAEIAWRPSETMRREANWTRFLAHCGLPDYAALATRASADPEWYWRALADWLQFRFRHRPDRMLDLTGGIAHPR